MKISKETFKKIIKEEIENVIKENEFANDPRYALKYTQDRVPVYKRRDQDMHGQDINPDIDEEPRADLGDTLVRDLTALGYDGKKIVSRIGDIPRKQLGSFLRLYGVEYADLVKLSKDHPGIEGTLRQ